MSNKQIDQITALVFDFGGVIIPVEPWGGWTPTPEERSRIHKAIADIATKFATELLNNNFSADDFKREFISRVAGVNAERLSQVIDSICIADQDLLKLISKLSLQYKIYGLVNAPFGWTEIRVGMHGLNKYFVRVVASHEINVRKPDVRIFQHFLDSTALEPGECLFIDNKKENVDAAQSLGMGGYTFVSVGGLMEYFVSEFKIDFSAI